MKFAMSSLRIVRALRSPPGWIALAYAVVATIWILFSDRLLSLLAGDPERWMVWSVYKGVGFVAVTSVLLFLLMRRTFGTMQKAVDVLRLRDVEIRRLNRLNAALSHINQAIVRMPVREELFDRVCKVLVEHGGFQLAWIGWHNPTTHQLEPLGVAGDENDYIQNLRVYVDDRPEGQGPAGRAFRDNLPYLCNDLSGDSTERPDRAEVLRRGFQASVALPVRNGEQVGGVLQVYSAEAGFFNAQEIGLLTEATADIAFALDNLAREEERVRAKTIADNERRFSDTMIESMPGILYFYDMNGRFLRWNQNFERVSGYTGEEIARMHPLDFFSELEKPEVEARINEVFIRGEAFVEASFLAKDGRSTPYFFTGRSVELDGRLCLVGMGIDLSQRKEAEAALRELNASLENKVAERTEELRTSLVRAEAADRIKSAFLATMSHELRTPLNSIIGFTGIVLQGLAGPLNPEQSKQLGMVRGSARHLLELINDVLDLSKIEAGQLEVRAEPFNLAESLERVIGIVRPLAEKKGLELVLHLDPGLMELSSMTGDRRRVEQVLLNLLNNGIKFTEHGRVTLTAGLDAGGQVRLGVADTGIGLKAEDLSSLFQPFRQIDSGLSRQHEGTGLGLAICRRLVALMGGEITVVSEWARGSEFTVLLPLQPCRPT